SFRFARARTHPIRKNPTGGPDRIRATSQAKSLSWANLALRRSANRPKGPGNTRQGAGTGACSRHTMWAARSRAVHPSIRGGAEGPSWSNRLQSSSRSFASSGSSLTTTSLGALIQSRVPQCVRQALLEGAQRDVGESTEFVDIVAALGHPRLQ